MTSSFDPRLSSSMVNVVRDPNVRVVGPSGATMSVASQGVFPCTLGGGDPLAPPVSAPALEVPSSQVNLMGAAPLIDSLPGGNIVFDSTSVITVLVLLWARANEKVTYI
jgi:hypothetical protein